jgi:hypothetical protein
MNNYNDIFNTILKERAHGNYGIYFHRDKNPNILQAFEDYWLTGKWRFGANSGNNWYGKGFFGTPTLEKEGDEEYNNYVKTLYGEGCIMKFKVDLSNVFFVNLKATAPEFIKTTQYKKILKEYELLPLDDNADIDPDAEDYDLEHYSDAKLFKDWTL